MRTEQDGRNEANRSLIYGRRRDDINMLKGLLHEGSLPWDEQSPNALFIEWGAYGTPLLIGRENFTKDGQLMGRAPLSAKQIIAKIDAEERRHAE